MAEISNIDSLEVWLEDQPKEICVALAFRVAARVFPAVENDVFELQWRIYDPTLSSIKNLLASFVTAYSPTHAAPVVDFNPFEALNTAAETVSDDNASVARIASAANVAALAAAVASSVATRAVIISATAATSAVYAATSTYHRFWESVSEDISQIDSDIGVQDLLKLPLWHLENPWNYEWQKKKQELRQSDRDYEFWINWYDRLLDGRPQNWEMLEEIALIDLKDWDQGAENVNELIAEIQAKYLRSATPLAERMEISPDTGRLRVVSEPMREADLYQNALEKVRDAMADLREGGLKNAHTAAEPVLAKLDRAFDRYVDSPQRMHDEFLKALKRTARLVEENELADDDDIKDFMQDLDTGAVDIRGSMPLVAQAVSRRASVRLRELEDDKKDVVRKGVEAVAELSDPQLAEELREDIIEVLDGEIIDAQGNQNLDAVDATDRTGSRLSRAYDIFRRAGGGLGAGSNVTTTVLQAIQIIARLFGL